MLVCKFFVMAVVFVARYRRCAGWALDASTSSDGRVAIFSQDNSLNFRVRQPLSALWGMGSHEGAIVSEVGKNEIRRAESRLVSADGGWVVCRCQESRRVEHMKHVVRVYVARGAKTSR